MLSGHANWEQVVQMMLGIRLSVGQAVKDLGVDAGASRARRIQVLKKRVAKGKTRIIRIVALLPMASLTLRHRLRHRRLDCSPIETKLP